MEQGIDVAFLASLRHSKEFQQWRELVRVVPHGLFVDERGVDAVAQQYSAWVAHASQGEAHKSLEKSRQRLFGDPPRERMYLVEGKRVLAGFLVPVAVGVPQQHGLPFYLGSLLPAAQHLHAGDPVLQGLAGVELKGGPRGVEAVVERRGGKVTVPESVVRSFVELVTSSRALQQRFPVAGQGLAGALTALVTLVRRAREVPRAFPLVVPLVALQPERGAGRPGFAEAQKRGVERGDTGRGDTGRSHSRSERGKGGPRGRGDRRPDHARGAFSRERDSRASQPPDRRGGGNTAAQAGGRGGAGTVHLRHDHTRPVQPPAPPAAGPRLVSLRAAGSVLFLEERGEVQQIFELRGRNLGVFLQHELRAATRQQLGSFRPTPNNRELLGYYEQRGARRSVHMRAFSEFTENLRRSRDPRERLKGWISVGECFERFSSFLQLSQPIERAKIASVLDRLEVQGSSFQAYGAWIFALSRDGTVLRTLARHVRRE